MKIKPTAETIWTRPAYLPYMQSPLTDETVRDAEKSLGCTLPQAFLDLLFIQNGGPIRFCIPDSDGDTIAGIGTSFPTVTGYDLSEHQEFVDFPLEGLVAFDGDGHWYHCLDFRGDARQPSVWYVDLECNDQHLVAKDFTSFLSLMELDIEGELVLSGVKDLNDAMAILQSLFKRDFEKKVTSNGVPYFMCKTGRHWENCFWLTGNRVARGFDRVEPDSFKFEGTALLFPELPADAVIFETSDKYIKKFVAKLGKAGLTLVDVNVAGQAQL